MRPERFSEIDVLPAGVRHRRRQFAVAERADDGHDARDDPDQQQQVPGSAPDERCRADTMKIAEPIIDPTTIIVASKRPRPLTRSVRSPVTPAEIVCACSRHVWFSGSPRTPAPSYRQILARPLSEIGAARRSRITATESAPARNTSAAVSIVIPPIATSGFRVSWRAARKKFDADDGIGILFGSRREDGTHCNIVRRSSIGFAQLREIVCRNAHPASASRRWRARLPPANLPAPRGRRRRQSSRRYPAGR